MDEWELRTLAAALRPELPALVGDGRAAELDALIAAALDRAPGRAKAELRGILLLHADPPVRDWVNARQPPRRAQFRLDVPSLTVRGWPGDTDAGSRDARAGIDERVLSFRIPALESAEQAALTEGERYPAVFMAGEDITGNLFGGGAAAALTGVPAEGLATRWTVLSRTARLTAPGPGVTVHAPEADRDQQWTATFSLFIPASGDSAQRRLAVTPLAAPEARLDVVIFVGDDVYRQLTVSLLVRPAEPETGRDPGQAAATAPRAVPGGPVAVIEERMVPAAQAGLRPAADWQRRARTLGVFVARDQAHVTCQETGSEEPFLEESLPWGPRQDAVETAVTAVRQALARLRDSVPGYFGGTGSETALHTLTRGYTPSPDWTAADRGGRSTADDGAWAAVAASRELGVLAYEGSMLYRAVFGDAVGDLIDAELRPGDQLKLTWRDGSGGWVPYLPLPLMYAGAAPEPDEPTDPGRFFGLRYRLARLTRPVPRSRALGHWSRTTRAHLLYWGSGPGDKIADEAARHRRELATWQPALMLPPGEGTADARELGRFLRAPEPAPVSLLYFYCHSRGGADALPALRFGAAGGADSELGRFDMGSGNLPDAPIVFVNACSTNAAAPLLANQLRELFFSRGCRGYIGAETEVPAVLAARFATVFFSFLYGAAGRAMAPVGEAVTQARRFLWTEYRDVGGLFYNYVGDYSLYAADDADVARLRTAPGTHESPLWGQAATRITVPCVEPRRRLPETARQIRAGGREGREPRPGERVRKHAGPHSSHSAAAPGVVVTALAIRSMARSRSPGSPRSTCRSASPVPRLASRAGRSGESGSVSATASS